MSSSTFRKLVDEVGSQGSMVAQEEVSKRSSLGRKSDDSIHHCGNVRSGTVVSVGPTYADVIVNTGTVKRAWSHRSPSVSLNQRVLIREEEDGRYTLMTGVGSAWGYRTTFDQHGLLVFGLPYKNGYIAAHQIAYPVSINFYPVIVYVRFMLVLHVLENGTSSQVSEERRTFSSVAGVCDHVIILYVPFSYIPVAGNGEFVHTVVGARFLNDPSPFPPTSIIRTVAPPGPTAADFTLRVTKKKAPAPSIIYFA